MSIVALESAVLAFGLPFPDNVETVIQMEQIICEEQAEPKTIGIIRGRIIAGLTEAQIQHLGSKEGVRKVSLRDMPVVKARGLDGATTVASTSWVAHRNNISVVATGGIGGVHRTFRHTGSASLDISADLDALATLPITVVCSGPKAILDLPATLEILETRGVTVVGYCTDELPAFYSRSSGLPVDVRCDTPDEVVEIVLSRRALGMTGSILVTVPAPEKDAIEHDIIERVIQEAHDEAYESGFTASRLTPFLLARVSEKTGRRALETNIALLKNNARIAARIARLLPV